MTVKVVFSVVRETSQIEKNSDVTGTPSCKKAEELQENAQKAYDKCTEIARKELQAFERQRLQAFREGLAAFAESQVKTARDTYALLVKCRASVNKIQL